MHGLLCLFGIHNWTSPEFTEIMHDKAHRFHLNLEYKKCSICELENFKFGRRWENHLGYISMAFRDLIMGRDKKDK